MDKNKTIEGERRSPELLHGKTTPWKSGKQKEDKYGE
jgi:hypothetical protein